jgi:hypothetical protein
MILPGTGFFLFGSILEDDIDVDGIVACTVVAATAAAVAQ